MTTGFLAEPPLSEAVQRLYDEDVIDVGYVMNASRLWAHLPEVHDELFSLMGKVTSARPFTMRERGILVTACASAYGDSYCSLAWGRRLAGVADDAELAAGVLRGDDAALTEPERALATWARKVARDPNATTGADVEALRAAGFSDADIFAATVYIGLRIAFSTVNDALGATPDSAYRESVPAAVREAVTFGRPIDR